ncbi:hypothetical protein CCP3SC1AL1_1620003 [Gammaproteobacteria bacterium]
MTKDDAKTVSSYHITKTMLVGSVELIALKDFKEHAIEHDKAIYHLIRNKLNRAIDSLQELHDIYSKAAPSDTIAFWQKLDELNKLIDENLLEK